jgi:hypothetical protein
MDRTVYVRRELSWMGQNAAPLSPATVWVPLRVLTGTGLHVCVHHSTSTAAMANANTTCGAVTASATMGRIARHALGIALARVVLFVVIRCVILERPATHVPVTVAHVILCVEMVPVTAMRTLGVVPRIVALPIGVVMGLVVRGPVRPAALVLMIVEDVQVQSGVVIISVIMVRHVAPVQATVALVPLTDTAETPPVTTGKTAVVALATVGLVLLPSIAETTPATMGKTVAAAQVIVAPAPPPIIAVTIPATMGKTVPHVQVIAENAQHVATGFVNTRAEKGVKPAPKTVAPANLQTIVVMGFVLLHLKTVLHVLRIAVSAHRYIIVETDYVRQMRHVVVAPLTVMYALL